MRYADTPTAEGVVQVDAPPGRVWALVTDMDLIAELSTELQEIEWLEGAAGPALGRTFRGRSVHEQVGEWETVSTVTEFEPEAAFAWTVSDVDNPTAIWRFSLTPTDTGTELRQWAQLGPGPSNLTTVIARMPEREERIVAHRVREWQTSIDRNLAAIKERAEG